MSLRHVVAGLVLLAVAFSSYPVEAQRPQQRKPPTPQLPDLKSPEDKLKFLEIIRNSFPVLRVGRSISYKSSDLDDQLEKFIQQGTETPLAPIVDDATFVRRVFLDLVGRPPSLGRLRDFVEDANPNKRSELIDELLETDDFARKQARYWRSVVFYDTPANRNTVNPQAFEDWLFDSFKSGTSWDRIVAEMVSATPVRKQNVPVQNNGWNQDYGPNNFVLANDRKPELIASATARIFMGLSIDCAECHNHPFDRWKREQFHEMAAFFAPGKYYMVDQYDPTQKSEMQAKFLLGEKPPSSLKPDQRRVAGAAYLIYNPDNYWFARAYVNRVWNELLGDGFYSVDSLGQDKEVVHQLVVNRLSASFRYAGFEPKWLFRIVMNSRAYQREARTIENEADLFTGVRPTRLRNYEVAAAIENLIGENPGLWRSINTTFEQNPSIPQRDLEGSIQEALLLMNNSTLNNRLANSELAQEMIATKQDDDLIEVAFLGVLARLPSSEEQTRYRRFVKESAKRNEAAIDLLWVLVNSAEFRTKL